MRRRTLVTGTLGGVVLGASAPAIGSAAVVGHDRLLFEPAAPGAAPVTIDALRTTMSQASANFHAVRYQQLARQLPELLRAAEATRDAAPTDRAGSVQTVLAEVYGLATRLSVKLHDPGVAWSMADRAVQAARACDDLHTLAETYRTAAVVLRRSGRHDEAQRMVIQAAAHLREHTRLKAGRDVSLYASMLATAAYTAARADRRDDAWTLAAEAGDALTSGTASGFGPNDLELYRSGIARALGDFGAAVDHASRVRIELFTTPERRARYWEDVALAWMGRGRAAEAWVALQEAEATAPQEVRYRPWAQDLTADLLARDRGVMLPGIRPFAARIQAAGPA
ncbi:hypothetical protein [Micromonospora tarensis]|uniref:Transcriptional regulator n=1 Tax=Micromonospora tarensis TaxID=2806100 RepID=A0ABS1Y983_9ACTN|nr:hypothetical protein [Micromonospora tarensis]MBM0273960.1 hypothetical protein [Micromonospora tarensis]